MDADYRQKIIDLITSQPIDAESTKKIRISEEIEYHKDCKQYTMSVFNLFGYTFRETFQVSNNNPFIDKNAIYGKLWGSIKDFEIYYSKGQKPPHVIAAERYLNNIITNNADERGEFIH